VPREDEMKSQPEAGAAALVGGLARERAPRELSSHEKVGYRLYPFPQYADCREHLICMWKESPSRRVYGQSQT
jgi:hypothetical protein